MRDADGGIGLVDVLAAGARGAVGVDLQVVVVDLDLGRLVDDRRDLEAREARLAAVGGVERAQPHEPVDALLGAVEAVGVLASDEEGRRLDAGLLPGLASSSSTSKPRFSAQRISIRSTISAQSCASVPPAPALIVTSASPASYLPENSRSSSSASRRRSTEAIWSASSPARSLILLRHLGERLEVVDVADQRPVGLQLAARARVLGADSGRGRLVVPEPGLAHLLLQLADARLQRAGVDVVGQQRELIADRLEALRNRI